jgi:hypothetical protein
LILGGIEPRDPLRRHGPHGHRERVTFGGIAFELLGTRAMRHDLEGADLRYLEPGAHRLAVADVLCSIQVGDPRPEPPERSNAIRLSAGEVPGTARVWARTLEAELTRLGPGRYAASARIDDVPEALVGLLRALTSAVMHGEGGLMLHTAAIELGGRAVLFVGPSGAGKSTAAMLADGARCFAYDHVALVRRGSEVLAWGLPGGTPANMPLADGLVYPVAAVLRVQQGPRDSRPGLVSLSGARALFALRESVECADPTPGGEEVYLHAATTLYAQLEVGVIRTVLGRPHGALLRDLVARSGQARCEEQQP